jgi:tetratricopeptide (TPR) repeat protein
MDENFMRNQFRRLAFIPVAALWILILESPAQADSNILNVQCNDQAGAPVSGVQVQIQHFPSKKVKDKKSDNKGLAAFNKLDDGVYRVLGRKEGFAPAFHEFTPLKNGAQQTVTLRLQPGDAKQLVYFEDQAVSQQAFEALKRGVVHLQGSKWAEAEKELLSSIEMNPSNLDAHFNLGIALIQQRKWDAAEAELKKTAELARVMKELAPPAAGSPDPNDEAEKRAMEVISKIPGLRLRDEGDKALAEKNFDTAIAKYNEAAKADPGDADLYYNMALAQANAKRFSDALKSIEKALSLKPAEGAYAKLKSQIAEYQQSEVLVRARGILEEGDKLYQAGDYAGALKKYEEARPMIPEKNQAGLWTQVGRTHAQMNNHELAVQAFNKAIEMAPDDANHRKALAQYYMNQKKYDEALKLYADPRTSGSEPVDQTLFNLAMNMSKQGNSEMAQLALERTIQANPNHAEAHYELGTLYFYDKKDNKRAQEMLKKYMELGKDKGHLDNANALLVVISKKKP